MPGSYFSDKAICQHEGQHTRTLTRRLSWICHRCSQKEMWSKKVRVEAPQNTKRKIRVKAAGQNTWKEDGKKWVWLVSEMQHHLSYSNYFVYIISSYTTQFSLNILLSSICSTMQNIHQWKLCRQHFKRS